MYFNKGSIFLIEVIYKNVQNKSKQLSIDIVYVK